MKEPPNPCKDELNELYEKLKRIRSTRHKIGAPEIEEKIKEIEKSRL